MNKLFFLLSTLLILTNACKKLERINSKDGIVGVTTSEAKQLDLSTLQISSSLTTIEGVAYVTQRGICWSTSPNPTIKDNFTNEGSGFGTFESKISGLSTNTTYYFRAFASNNKTTAYGNEVSFQSIDGLGQILSDVDGNNYKTVYIGSQQWMAENLKVSKYSDGTTIPNITDNPQWSKLTSSAWAYYNNDAAYNVKYGKLYNWYAVSKTTNGNKNVCPTGWHVPTDAEWTVLTDYLGGLTVAGGKMKEVGTTSWNSPNTDVTNASLFSALPGGFRFNDGSFFNIGYYGYWWSSTDFEFNTLSALIRFLNNNNGNANRYYRDKKFGLSVRCLRD